MKYAMNTLPTSYYTQIGITLLDPYKISFIRLRLKKMWIQIPTSIHLS